MKWKEKKGVNLPLSAERIKLKISISFSLVSLSIIHVGYVFWRSSKSTSIYNQVHWKLKKLVDEFHLVSSLLLELF